MKNSEIKKKKLIDFIEKNIINVLEKEPTNSKAYKRAKMIRMSIKKLNYMSIIMYYYHSIIKRKDVYKEHDDKLPTFESKMKEFEKVMKKIAD